MLGTSRSRHSGIATLLSACCVMATSTLAQAQPQPTSTPAVATSPIEVTGPEAGVHTHDGFWLELGLQEGIGLYRTSSRIEREGSRGRLRAAGRLSTLGITLGTALTPRWSIGASAEFGSIYGLALSHGGRALDAQKDSLLTASLSLLVRHYLPVWHLAATAGVGIGSMNGVSGDPDDDSHGPNVLPRGDAGGLYTQLGLAKLFWFGQNWSFGAQSRLVLMSGSVAESHVITWGMGVGFVLCYQ